MRRVFPALFLATAFLVSCSQPKPSPTVTTRPSPRPPYPVIVSPTANGVNPDRGAVKGKVVDAQGAPIANATVELTKRTTNEHLIAKTSPDGVYSWNNLESGDYSMKVKHDGFGEGPGEKLHLEKGNVAEYSTILSAGPDSETVPVSANRRDEAVPAPERSPASVDAEQNSSVQGDDDSFDAWLKGLPFGEIKHHVIGTMLLGRPTSVTVTIAGQTAAPMAPDSDNTPEKLQVSPYMWVLVTQPDNPDGFKIVDGDDPENPRKITSNGQTTWTWTVTPQRLGDLKLHIEAFVLMGKDLDTRVSYNAYDKPVHVRSVTLWGYVVSGWTWVLENPVASLKYLLPGGGGAAIIAVVIKWLRGRLKKRKAEPTD